MEQESPKPTAILGYRILSEIEKLLVNDVKHHAEATRILLEDIKQIQMSEYLVAMQVSASDDEMRDKVTRNMDAERWRAMARDHFQLAYMQLVRSITNPTTF